MADRSCVYGDPNRRDSVVLNSGWLANHSVFSTGCGGVRFGEAPRGCLRRRHAGVFRVSGLGGDTGLPDDGGDDLFQ